MPTTEKLVTLKRLGNLLDAYGADPDRWPEQERAAALALIDSSSDARAMRDDARSLDSVLDFVEQPAISPALARRVQKLHRPARRNPLSAIFAGLIPWMHDRFRPAPRFAWQGAVAAAGVIGIATGVALSEFTFEQPRTAAPVTELALQATEPFVSESSVILVGSTDSEGSLALTTALDTDFSELSLTGNDNASSDTLIQADDSEITTASIPLY